MPTDISALSLSAETPRLVATPDPYGKPGGPGLYRVRGMKHSNYFEHIVHALIRSGHTPGDASKIAWGALRRWAAGKGHVTPEVQAAAAAALAEEEAKAKAARAMHNTAPSISALELSGTSAGAAKHARATNGQFTRAGGGGTPRAASGSKKVLSPQAHQQIRTLKGKLQQINTSIKKSMLAIQSDIKALATAKSAAAAAASSGTSTSSSSTSAGNTAASGTTASTSPSTSSTGTSSTSSSSSSSTQTVSQAQAQLATDRSKLSALRKQRQTLTTQIQKLEG